MAGSLKIPEFGTLLTVEEQSALLEKFKREILDGVQEILKDQKPPVEDPKTDPRPIPDEPKPPILKKCKKSPKIESVKRGKAKNELAVIFDAEDVFEIRATATSREGRSLLKAVKSGQDGHVISSKTDGEVFTPDFNNPILILESDIPESGVTIQFEATKCDGKSEPYFFLKQ